MTPLLWPCPTPDGGLAEEYALTFDRGRSKRLLIVPALFEEANRLRRLTVETMRRLDRAGVDTILPDLPGTGESLQPLEAQRPDTWSAAVDACVDHFGATHLLGMRGGCLFTGDRLPRTHYAAVEARALLRHLVRARMLASRELGREESRDAILEQARTHGVELAGYRLGAAFVRAFEPLVPADGASLIDQDELGGAGLWLRAEPGESVSRADALAAAILAALP